MTRIVIVGAGGHVFPLRLMNDFLAFPALRGAQYVLMDIDAANLARTERLTRRLAESQGIGVHLETTTDLVAAVRGADVVITCFQAGGLDAYAADIEIPRRYGIDQTVGDTLGPGGVFRGLRSMRALDAVSAAMLEHAPGALLLNYTNPMSINCALTSLRGVRTIGLCHSVQHTADELADIMGYEPGSWSFRAAGINHQSWMLEFRHDGRDVLDELRDGIRAYNRGEREPARPIDEWYAGGREAVRTAIMELTGYFQTESSHHASDYYPWFRRTPDETQSYLPQRWDYLEIGRAATDEDLETLVAGFSGSELEPSVEYAARIVDSMVTGTSRTVYGNVPNTALITNLPDRVIVEVPILVDGSGPQPTVVGDLPVPCAALNLATLGLQTTALEAYLTGSRDLVVAAVAADRLTSSLLGLDRIGSMVDELIAAESSWLPELR
jgi:alpha-galactosidase